MRSKSLIIGETAHEIRRISLVAQFLEQGWIPSSPRPRFDAAVASAMRLRSSVFAEALLIATVGPEVKRLDEIKVGDIVSLSYTEALMVDVAPAGKPAPKEETPKK